MSAPWSSLAVLAAVCVLFTLISWAVPPTTPLWVVMGFAVVATVLILHGPDSLAQVLRALSDVVGRWRGH